MHTTTFGHIESNSMKLTVFGQSFQCAQAYKVHGNAIRMFLQGHFLN
jgi:hypothetical protein